MSRTAAELAEKLGFPAEPGLALWRQALTHRSAEGLPHYERLEFLGDAVLKLVVSQWLYERHAELSEGEMTKVRARTVSDETLARSATALGLGEYLVLGPTERKSGGKKKVGILASSFEAVLGAIHLLHGPAAADAFLERWLADELAASLRLGGQDNFKAVLQELTQQRFRALPEYRLMAEIGPEHDRFYDVGVWIEGECRGQGRGRSKKSAEQAAAEQALAELKPKPTAPEVTSSLKAKPTAPEVTSSLKAKPTAPEVT